MSESVGFNEAGLLASICKESFFEFVVNFWDIVPGAQPLKMNWHIEVLCQELQTIAERIFAGLPKEHDCIVNISPGTSKSSICSILFPAWAWARMPSTRVVIASHTDILVLDLANKCRAVIKSEAYRACFPGIEIRDDQDTKSYYINNYGGNVFTCTVGGKSPMGTHAHILIVDDPIDPKKAGSEAELKIAAEFMTDVISTRKVDKLTSVTFLIMQRLAVQDPTGVLLEKAKKEHTANIRHICLPASTEGGYEVKPAYLKKYYDENNGLMDPVRLPMSVLRDYMTNRYMYAAQFGQNPQNREGKMFADTYFNNRVRAAPFEAKRIRYWDRASTPGGGCYTAGVLMAKDKNGYFYVEHVVHGQWGTYERNAKMRATALRDRNKYGPNYEPVVYNEAEGGSSGRDAWREVARALAGFTVKEDRPTGDKVTRAEPWSSQLAAGNVFIVDDGTWDVGNYIQEHVSFPEGTFKDQVDSSSGAFNLLVNRKVMGGLRSIQIKNNSKKSKLRIIVCRREELHALAIQNRALLVNIMDPQAEKEEHDTHFSSMLLGCVDLSFADLNPADLQDCWELPVHPWNETPDKLIIQRHHGKKLWAFLLKKRELPPEIIIIEDDNQDRGKSVAYAVCDSLHLPREKVVYTVAEPDSTHRAAPPREHIYSAIRAGRHCVVE